MRNMIINLISSFLLGIFTLYLFTRTLELKGVIICLIGVGILALGYLVVYLVKKLK